MLVFIALLFWSFRVLCSAGLQMEGLPLLDVAGSFPVWRSGVNQGLSQGERPLYSALHSTTLTLSFLSQVFLLSPSFSPCRLCFSAGADTPLFFFFPPGSSLLSALSSFPLILLVIYSLALFEFLMTVCNCVLMVND